MVVTLEEKVAPQVDCNTTSNPLEISLLTGGIDRPYAYGLAMALAAKKIHLDVVGSDEIDSPEMHATPNVTFLNLWPTKKKGATSAEKVSRTLRHYAWLIRYAMAARPRVFHILWNSKIQLFDRTLLMLYYKALGKRVAITVHNVNQGRRDSNDSFLNRITLRVQYRLANHMFVHTRKMKGELVEQFGVHEQAVTVIRHPINNAFPETDLTYPEARYLLGIENEDKTMLCLGRIKPYKGIEHLLSAFQQLAVRDKSYKLIIAGEVQRGNEEYLESLNGFIHKNLSRDQVILKTRFIPDEEMEVYLKAADVLVLPYNEIFQSGVLFLGYSFGLPVIATDVGSFREEIIEGQTGYICKPSDPWALAAAVERYFASELYLNLETRRQEIKKYAKLHHSWDAVAELTSNVYAELLGRQTV